MFRCSRKFPTFRLDFPETFVNGKQSQKEQDEKYPVAKISLLVQIGLERKRYDQANFRRICMETTEQTSTYISPPNWSSDHFSSCSL